MAAAAKTVITFALAAVPGVLYTATQSSDIRLNQLHKDDHQRIRYKKVSTHCGTEVKLRQLIEDKIAGKEVVAAAEEGNGNVIDLMEALQASLAQAGPEPRKPAGRRKTTKGA